MPQEPITRHFNLKKDGAGHDLIDAVLKPSKTVVDNRKKMNGTEFKGFADQARKDEQQKENEKYIRAAIRGDTAYMFRAQKKFTGELKSLVAAGDMTMMEYKSLQPWVEGTDAYGGYSAPPAFLAELARNLGNFTIARKHFRQIAMSSWIENVQNLTVKPTVAFVAENAAIPASIPNEGRMTLTASKLAGLFPVTNEQLEDSNFPIWSTMQDIFQEQFGITEDTWALQDSTSPGGANGGALAYGDGTLTASGDIVTAGIIGGGAIGIARGGSVSSGKTGFPKIGDTASASDCWADLLYMLDAQPSAYYQAGKFFIDQQVAIAMFSLRDTQNRFIADIVNGITVEIGLEGQPKVFFKGYEMVIVPKGIMLNANTTAYTTSAVPSTPFTFFCNPQRCWLSMGQRGGFRFDNLREGTLDSTSLAANDLQALRMIERLDFGCALPSTMVVLRTSAT